MTAPRRILVTGASGVFGREIIERLHRQGHHVVGLSRRRPALPAGVEFQSADIRDVEAVSAAMDGCDVVAHCAWAVEAMHGDASEREINIGGTENVLVAMERTGARRIVFASSSTAYGPRPDTRSPLLESTPLAPHPEHVYGNNKQEVEALLAAAPVDEVCIRAVVVAGRHIDNRIRNLLAGPRLAAVRGEEQIWQLVHSEDVGRFFALACEKGPAGPVNLAAPGLVTVDEVGAAIGRRVVRVPGATIDRVLRALWDRKIAPVSPADLAFLRHQPILDTTRMTYEFGFTCGWTGPATIEDTRLSVMGMTGVGDRAFARPTRVAFHTKTLAPDTPPLDGGELVAAGPAEWEGEFDTPIDPRFGTFTSTNLSEALPGPATPLSLTTVAVGVRDCLASAADLVGMSGVAGLEAHARFEGIFAHRLFVNVTCGSAIGELSPGWDAASIADQYLGRHADEVDMGDPSALPLDRPRSIRAKFSVAAGLGVRTVGLAVGYRRDVDDVVAEVARLERLVGDPTELGDETLEALFLLARDLCVHGWRLAALGAVLAGAATANAEKVARRAGVVALYGETPISGEGLTGVQTLARSAISQPAVADILRGEGVGLLDQVRAASPTFAVEVESALARFGHRGPAECELASTSFADDPDVLLRAVGRAMGCAGAKVASLERPPVRRAARPIAKYAAKVTSERERNRDRVVRTIWIMRRLAREQGRRLAERGVIERVDDVFFLTADQLFFPPPDAHAVVARRRAERDRLATIRLPVAFTDRWVPQATELAMRTGESLIGVAASPGVAEGMVRIVTPRSIGDLLPGEILVANVTDVGYTPMFGYAAAVVTDIGGMMSHAAVVAREFGVPAVVDTATASTRLVDGMRVRVDGSAGTVLVLD